MNKTTKYVCLVALGTALYVVLSFFIKIPLIGHIGLDLGYIAIAVYAYHFGCVPAMLTGALGCTLVSVLLYGWFPPGWFLGNVIIGAACGYAYKYRNLSLSICVTAASVFVGIVVVKTVVECLMFGIPVAIKVPKNAVAAVADFIVMCIGLLIAPRIKTEILAGRMRK